MNLTDYNITDENNSIDKNLDSDNVGECLIFTEKNQVEVVFCSEEFNFVCQSEEICIGNIRCGWENETLIDILVGSLVAGTSFLIILIFLVIFQKKICKRR